MERVGVVLIPHYATALRGAESGSTAEEAMVRSGVCGNLFLLHM